MSRGRKSSGNLSRGGGFDPLLTAGAFWLASKFARHVKKKIEDRNSKKALAAGTDEPIRVSSKNKEFNKFVDMSMKEKTTPPPIPKGKKLASLYASYGIDPKELKTWPKTGVETPETEHQMSGPEHLANVVDRAKHYGKTIGKYLNKRPAGGYWKNYLDTAKRDKQSDIVSQDVFNKYMQTRGLQRAPMTALRKSQEEKRNALKRKMVANWHAKADKESGLSQAMSQAWPRETPDWSKPYGGNVRRRETSDENRENVEKASAHYSSVIKSMPKPLMKNRKLFGV